MSVINANPLLAAAGGDYQISRSVRLRSSASAYLNRTFGTPTSGTTWTWSGWVKLGTIPSTGTLFEAGTGATNTFMRCTFGQVSAELNWRQVTAVGGLAAEKGTSMLFRDPSAWYHIVCVWDTSNATAADRQRVYVNGLQVTAFGASTNPSLNLVSYFNTASYVHYLGALNVGGLGGYLDGYLTEVNFIDGQALTASSFGETDAVTGVWKPKKYTGTYGTNGFYLNFSDNSAATAAAIGKDSSGNGNNWTPNNISVTAGVTYDSMLDVPTLYADGGNGRGNYAVFNPLSQSYSVSNKGTPSDGNLKFTVPAGTTTVDYIEASIPCSGKVYVELQIGVAGTGGSFALAAGVAQTVGTNNAYNSVEVSYTYTASGTPIGLNSRTNGGVGTTISSFTPVNNDMYGFAIDADTGKVWVSRNNGAWIGGGNPVTGTTPTYTFNTLAYPMMVFARGREQGNSCVANFGQRPFTYTPPTGFKALNTQNLPDSTIKKGNQYFNATTYTGNNSTNVITNAGAMQPDLVWIKSRSSAVNHMLNDSVRGVGIDLYPNLTNAESNTGLITSFNSNGFSLGPDGGGAGNGNGLTYVGWQWKKGATQGFDIVTYTGNGSANRTVSHSLGVTPAMVIVKNRSSGTPNWRVWHQGLSGSTYYLGLNQTAAQASSSTVFNGFSSTTFTVGTDPSTNENASNFVAYCFAKVDGFSKFGSYTGNGSADGPFVYCGFRPRYVMIKRTDGVADWVVLDTSRDLYNMEINYLVPNTSGAEAAGASVQLDGVSNGIKIRGTWAGMNASGGTYIYAAFAEVPTKYALAR